MNKTINKICDAIQSSFEKEEHGEEFDWVKLRMELREILEEVMNND